MFLYLSSTNLITVKKLIFGILPKSRSNLTWGSLQYSATRIMIYSITDIWFLAFWNVLRDQLLFNQTFTTPFSLKPIILALG